MNRPMRFASDPLLLDEDVWDAPDHMTADECLDATGVDWRRAEPSDHDEDDR